ncbi:MAG: hypothetical protein RJA52_324 [Bacteroidota bacterium]|jgi:uncharacterized phosphosugar-binding protein
MFEYYEKVKEHLDLLVTADKSEIIKAAEWFSETLIKDKIVHTFGTGHSHMIGLELFVRAGGLANVNAMLDSTVMTAEGARRSAEIERISGLAKVIWDQHEVDEDDIMIVISNSGRNAMPIEMAMMAKEKGLKVIGITSMDQSQKYPSRHPSGKKLFEIVDIVLDNKVPPGDGLLTIEGTLTGAISSIAGIFLVNLVATEAMKIAHQKGIKLPIYYSQNIDGYSNEELYSIYKNRIKHL